MEVYYFINNEVLILQEKDKSYLRKTQEFLTLHSFVSSYYADQFNDKFAMRSHQNQWVIMSNVVRV